MNPAAPPGPGQLSWRCRRGMRELDLILTGWLQGRWELAAEAERRAFERFLELPDPMLAGYLLHDERPEPEFRELVEQMRGGSVLAD